MAWGISSLFGRSEAAAATSSSTDPALAEQSRLIFQRKTEALGLARATAEAEGRAPNLTDYWRAALTMPELEGNARIIADLSGQTIDGFTIRAQDLRPTTEQIQSQMSDVTGPQVEGRTNGIRALRNFLDADGNGTIEVEEISGFYREASAYLRLDNAQMHNVTFQPATTLEIFANARGAQFANITLDGLGAGETLTIGTDGSSVGTVRESYANVRVINDQGGVIRVNSNATVNGLTLENGNTVLEVSSRGRVNSLNVQSETVSLRMQTNGELFLPNFDGATFTPASTMAGAIIQGNPMDTNFHGFRDSNLNGMSFDGANISGIDFVNSDMTGTTFVGGRLSNVTFSRDMDLSTADFSGLRHAHNVQITENGRVLTTFNNADELRNYIAGGQQLSVDPVAQAMALGREVFAPAIASIGQAPAPQAPVPMEQATAAAVSSGRTLVVGGEHIATVSETLADGNSANQNVPISDEKLAELVNARMESFVSRS